VASGVALGAKRPSRTAHGARTIKATERIEVGMTIDLHPLPSSCSESQTQFRREPQFVDHMLGRARLALHWYAPAVHGMERMPAEDPFLIVGNHSGGFWMPDMWIFLDAWLRQHGVEREAYSLAYDLLFRPPGARTLLNRMGVLQASTANAEAALDRGAPVLVYPGGDWEACRPFSHRHRIEFHGHSGFIRLALRRQVPVVPVVSHGSHESLIILTRGERLARLLQLHRLRVNVFPIVVGFPFGVASIAVPFVPLPTQVTVEVLPPLDWSHFGPAAADDPAVVRRCYDEITGLMQGELDSLARRQPFAVMRRFRQ
jgi:1-acyl-sn-glycerol-3-phosphate acyltransferase